MIKTKTGEKFREIPFPKNALRLRYGVSNLGRLISYSKNFKDGTLLRGTLLGGYVTLKVKPRGKDKTIFIHKLIAAHFSKKPSPKNRNVIHLNFNKSDNRASNLKWVTDEEMNQHHRKSPALKKHLLRLNSGVRIEGLKLTPVKVKKIKLMLRDEQKNYSLMQLAKKFHVSDMQIHRIKSGQNWSHVKV